MALTESTSEKQKTLIGVFPDLPECLKAWDVVKKIASSGGDVSVNNYYDYKIYLYEFDKCFDNFWLKLLYYL